MSKILEQWIECALHSGDHSADRVGTVCEAMIVVNGLSVQTVYMCETGQIS
jgi:hypothetical protein